MSWKRRRRVAFTGEELLQYSLKFWNPGVGHVPDLVQIDADVVVDQQWQRSSMWCRYRRSSFTTE